MTQSLPLSKNDALAPTPASDSLGAMPLLVTEITDTEVTVTALTEDGPVEQTIERQRIHRVKDHEKNIQLIEFTGDDLFGQYTQYGPMPEYTNKVVFRDMENGGVIVIPNIKETDEGDVATTLSIDGDVTVRIPVWELNRRILNGSMERIKADDAALEQYGIQMADGGYHTGLGVTFEDPFSALVFTAGERMNHQIQESR